MQFCSDVIKREASGGPAGGQTFRRFDKRVLGILQSDGLSIIAAVRMLGYTPSKTKRKSLFKL